MFFEERNYVCTIENWTICVNPLYALLLQSFKSMDN